MYFVYQSVMFECLPVVKGEKDAWRGCLITCFCSIKIYCCCIVVFVDSKTNDRVSLYVFFQYVYLSLKNPGVHPSVTVCMCGICVVLQYMSVAFGGI